MVNTTVSAMRSPRSVTSADTPRAKPSSLVESCPWAPPWLTCVSHPPTSANATSRPTPAFVNCAICFNACPNGLPGYSAPCAGRYFDGSATFNILMASNASRPMPFSTRSAAAAYCASKDAPIISLFSELRIPNCEI